MFFLFFFWFFASVVYILFFSLTRRFESKQGVISFTAAKAFQYKHACINRNLYKPAWFKLCHDASGMFHKSDIMYVLLFISNRSFAVPSWRFETLLSVFHHIFPSEGMLKYPDPLSVWKRRKKKNWPGLKQCLHSKTKSSWTWKG